MSDHKPTSFVLPAVAALMALLAAYVGAYYRLVGQVAVDDNESENRIRIAPHYYRGMSEAQAKWEWKWEDKYVNPFFTPSHWLDRRIRPNVWEPTP